MPATGPLTDRRAAEPVSEPPFVFLRVPRPLWQQVVNAAPPGTSATKEAVARLAASFAAPEPEPNGNGRRRA